MSGCPLGSFTEATKRRATDDGGMKEQHGRQEERAFLERLLEQHAIVANDLVAIDPGIWAVHGVIPAGEHVIMAEFDRPEKARAVLDSLPPSPAS